jgi:hypothetical protein
MKKWEDRQLGMREASSHDIESGNVILDKYYETDVLGQTNLFSSIARGSTTPRVCFDFSQEREMTLLVDQKAKRSRLQLNRERF